MKWIEKDSRRRFESGQVHQKRIDTVYNVHHWVIKWFGHWAEIQFSFDGPALVIDWVKSNEMDSPAM